MQAEYRGLGFDPAPGSADAVAAAADRFARAAEQVGSAAAIVRDVTGSADSWWAGTASAAFVAGLERAPAELTTAGDTVRAAAEIMDGWAGTLLANQRRADELDRAAVELRRAIDAAAGEVAAAATAVQVAIGSAARTAHAAHVAAVTTHDELRRELDRVLDQARALHQRHEAAAHRVAERLRALGDDGTPAVARLPDHDELFGGLVHALGSYSTRAGELALTLLGGPSPGTAGPAAGPAAGAVDRFAMALAGPSGDR
jgi:hypothetical protein